MELNIYCFVGKKKQKKNYCFDCSIGRQDHAPARRCHPPSTSRPGNQWRRRSSSTAPASGGPASGSRAGAGCRVVYWTRNAPIAVGPAQQNEEESYPIHK